MPENMSAGPQRRQRRERTSPYVVADAKVLSPNDTGSQAAAPPSPQTGVAEPTILKPGSTSQLISGRFLLLENLEGSSLRRCVDLITEKEYACRAISRQSGAMILEAHFRLEFSEYVAQPVEIITSGMEQFILYKKNFGDIHGLVRDRQVRDEAHAQMILRQVVTAVMDCHSAGVVLTDLKMRRFVFTNAERTKVVLETLEDSTLLTSEDDMHSYRRIGYPAYLAPEAISCPRGGMYAGRQADVWGLGVIIYTVLIGKYPFNDANPLALFSKILQGEFFLPEALSTHAKCLIRNILRKDALERLSADDILGHPWFADKEESSENDIKGEENGDEIHGDQVVPLSAVAGEGSEWET